MITSIFDPALQQVLDQSRTNNGVLFPSPEDWRDVPIYFLMLDRFNNPAAPPNNLPFDAPFGQFQGGTYQGVTAQLDYIKSLGFGALWLSPVLKNRQSDPTAYHGYGIQNFLTAEPRFASNPANADAELRALVDAAHQLGLYIIFDIVLHHSGDIFSYVPGGADTGWQNQPIGIQWRDENGNPNPAWATAPASPPLDAAVFPDELRHNELFTRQGDAFSNGGQPQGDFDSLKGINFGPQTNLDDAGDVLIRAYQYVIARFDVDAFRIDTLKYIPADYERTFGNAMREFALSAGKKNFFTFGEVYDNETEIAQFIGRNTTDINGVVGVDAALDYPLFFVLPNVLKGLAGTPADLAQVFQNRKVQEESVLTSHGEAGQYFVTFLDNHDQAQRFGYTGPVQFVDQIILGVACLASLQGVPCLYYGTEQGLSGHKHDNLNDDSMVREALWGKPGGGFAVTNPIYAALQQLMQVRASQPVLRYGRQYFRPLSGDGTNFGLSTYSSGILAFSRILNDQEIVFVANLNRQAGFNGEVIIDINLHTSAAGMKPLFSNLRPVAGLANAVFNKPGGSVTINEVDGSVTNGPALTVQVQLQPGEAQLLA
jgi:glycosidase